MKTRVDKYFQETNDFAPKRVSKNTNLYEEIKNSELNNLNIGSNAKVIGENDSHMNIDKIKEILEKNYQDPPRKRSMKFDIPEDEELELEKTREYDINAILEQAREEKEVDYQKERLKKIRDTQYDILKNLELEAKSKTVSNEDKTKEELLELINTINLNEYQNKNNRKDSNETSELDPLDLLSDLKGDDNTVVAGAKEFVALEEKIEEISDDEEEQEESLDDSFYSNSMSFSKKDFADFEDLESNGNGIVVKILIGIVFLAIVVGVVIFLNEFLSLGWF